MNKSIKLGNLFYTNDEALKKAFLIVIKLPPRVRRYTGYISFYNKIYNNASLENNWWTKIK